MLHNPRNFSAFTLWTLLSCRGFRGNLFHFHSGKQHERLVGLRLTSASSPAYEVQTFSSASFVLTVTFLLLALHLSLSLSFSLDGTFTARTFRLFSSQSLCIKATGRALRKGCGHWDYKASEENSSVGKSRQSVPVWRRLWLLWLTNRCSAFSFWNVRLDPQHRGTKTDILIERVMKWTELNQTPW